MRSRVEFERAILWRAASIKARNEVPSKIQGCVADCPENGQCKESGSEVEGIQRPREMKRRPEEETKTNEVKKDERYVG